MAYRLDEIVSKLGGELIGDGSIIIEKIATLSKASAGTITFLANPRYRNQLATTRASAVIISKQHADQLTTSGILSDNPYLYFARLAQLLHPQPNASAGIHPTAVVDETANISPTAEIGPGVVIGKQVTVGDACIIGPRSTIGDHGTIGANTLLHAGVTLYANVTLGERVIIHSGAVIGGDGFGFAPDNGRWVKIPQVGGVIIGNDVEIGANTTIDAGAIEPTIIHDGSKIDNLVMIAHNVEVGEHTVMAACCGISGSTKIGNHCMLGGSVGTAGHLEIAGHTVLLGASNVTKTIKEPGVYSSCIPVMPQKQWLKNIAHLKQLDAIATNLRKIDPHLLTQEEQNND